MKPEPIRVPVPKPFTRVPIKPAVRHKDKRRQEKHPLKEQA
jgi:hypothetical protein